MASRAGLARPATNPDSMKVRIALAETLAFLVRHWAVLVFGVILVLVAFVFVPRHMFGAIIVTACVGTGIAVGHWWV